MQPHLRLGKDAVSKFYNDTSGAINLARLEVWMLADW